MSIGDPDAPPPRLDDALHALGLGAASAFDRALANAPFGVYVDHPERGCIYANATLLEQFGVGWPEFAGFGWARRVYTADVPQLQAAIEAYEHRLGEIVVRYRVEVGAELRWIHARVHAVVDAAGNHVGSVGVTRDITAERALRTRAGESQKLEAVGRLSARVAHDFNNLLGAVLMAASSIDAGALSPDDRESIETILEAVEQGRQVTGQLLLITRHQPVVAQVCDADLVISRLAPLLRRTVGDGVKLTLHLDADGALVPLDVGRLGQILINLASNAHDALAGRGRVLVTTRRIGDTLHLAVTDNGCGMDDDTRARALEAFFSTKPSGRGTGLGLATVLDITTMAGGRVDLDSAPDQGTTVSVHLPIVDAQGRPDGTSPNDGFEMPDLAGLEVLVIEDHDALRQITAYTLALHGCTVKTASSLAEARALLSSGTVDAVVTDVLLPDGASVKLLGPGLDTLPVLFVSGFVGDAVPELEPGPGRAFLPKPYTAAALLRALGGVIAERH